MSTSSPVAPGDLHTRDELAEALTALRTASGLTVRDVVRRTGLPLSTVGGYFSGRHLPPLAAIDQFTGLLAVLGVPEGDVPGWVDVVTRLRRAPGRRPAGALAPYVGLAAYQVDDAPLFFGREALTEQLAAMITASPSCPVVVVGSSGSGKSSLLRAGVQARLTGLGISVTTLTPGAEPAGKFRAVRDAATPGGVLVVDQLEELFTSGLAPEEVEALVRVLAEVHGAGTCVVLALRADFFDAALEVPELAGWLGTNQLVVGPLSVADLRRVVVEPARVAGIEVEDGLVELLVVEATAGSASRTGLDAGALPLASHALYVTWLASSGRRLTLDQYRAVGRLPGAIAQSAEQVHESLDPAAAAAERTTLLRLVHVGAGTVDTRRVADAHEFEAPEQAAVIQAYVAARLLTSDRGQVQIAHEALLSAWPRMREWLDADRDGLRTHGRLTEAARRWTEADEDRDLLYRGAALETAERWLGEAAVPPDLSRTERTFFEASRAAEQARARVQRARTRRLRILSGTLAVLTVSTGTLATVSVRQARASAHDTDLAVSRQLAVTSQSLASTDSALAGQLAVAANERAETVESRSALLSASGLDVVSRLVKTGDVVNALAVSPDGSTLAAGTGSGKVLLERLGTHPQQLAVVTGPDTAVYGVRYSPDGRYLAIVGDHGQVLLEDVRHAAAPVTVPVDAPPAGATFYDVTFGPDGARLFAGASDGTVHELVRAADGSWSQHAVVHLEKGTVQAVATNPAGTLLAAAGTGNAITLWDVSGDTPTPVGTPFVVAQARVTSLAFSPDGTTLAAGSVDAGVHLWDVRTPTAPVSRLELTGAQSWTNHVAFSPDGKELAAASSDQHLWVWDATTGLRLDSFVHPTTLVTAAWAPDGRALYSGGSDGVLREWQLPGATLQGFTSIPGQGVFGTGVIATATTDGVRLWDGTDRNRTDLLALAPPPAGARLDGAVAISDQLHLLVAGDTAGGLHFWDISDPRHPVFRTSVAAHSSWIETITFDTTGRTMAASSDDSSITTWDLSAGIPSVPTGRLADLGGFAYGISFSPDRRTLVAAILTGHVDLVDVTDLTNPRLRGVPLTGPVGYVYAAAFSPNGRTIAASGNDKTVWLWDATDPDHPTVLGQPLVWADGYANNLLFSPDGHQLAGGMSDGTVRIWDVTDPAAPQRYASLGGIAGQVYGISYSADGSLISGAGADRTVRIWDVTASSARARVCTAATRGLVMSPAEWSRFAGTLVQPAVCG